MVPKSGINRTEFKIALVSNIMCLLGDFFLLKPSVRDESVPHRHHDFALSSFNHQVWINFWKKSIQGSSRYLRAIARTRDEGFSRQSLLLNIGCSRFFMKPIYKGFLVVRNLDIGVVIQKILGRFSSKETDEKAAFSINDPCKVSQFCISHNASVLNTIQYAINPIFVQRKRLNSLALLRDAIV